MYNESYLLSKNRKIRRKFIKALQQSANIVASTMGAKGRPVTILTELGLPRVTNDGISVIRSLNFEDPIEQLATVLLKDVSAKTNWECGDFSSGSAVLAEALISNRVKLDKSTDILIEDVINYIKRNSKEVKTKEDLINIATVSSKDEELGKLIGELSWEINKNSSVVIKTSATGSHYFEAADGTSIRGYFAAQEFYRGMKETNLGPKIMLINDEVIAYDQISPLFTMIARDETKERLQDDYIIFAKSFSQEVVTSVAMVNEKYSTSVRLATLQLPAKIAQETFDNLALITKGIVMGGKSSNPLIKGDKSALSSIYNYGTVKELKIHRVPNQEFIFIPKEDFKEHASVKEKIKELTDKVEDKTSPEHVTELNKILLNQIDGKIAYLYIAGDGEVETEHVMLKSEDAINACKSAKEMGIVAGGSVVIRDAALQIARREKKLAKALTSLYYHIIKNAKLNKRRKFVEGEGYNVATGEVGDMFEMKIIDPCKSLVHGIRNAYSLAKQINDSSTIIIKKKND